MRLVLTCHQGNRDRDGLSGSAVVGTEVWISSGWAGIGWSKSTPIMAPARSLNQTPNGSRDAANAAFAATGSVPSSRSTIGTRIGEAGRQLNGMSGVDPRTGVTENSPPGFERTIQLYLEPSVGPRTFGADREGLQRLLSGPLKQAMGNLCRNGQRLAYRLVIVNGTGTHVWTDLRAVGVTGC
ncbi:hypothetical protein [Longispora fulva]|uniref:hypothetical protein n=1 Tax=Longispora fulva TaxID=619741 RepID=UPI00363A357A